MHLPKISIVTPSFNQGQYLEQTILSVLGQMYPNLEYIIIDGGSTDNSVKIIEKYEKYITYWLSEPDRGQAHAINKAIRKSTGEIVTWLNSDDYYMEGALMKIGNFFRNNDRFDIVFGNSIRVDHNGKVLNKLIPQVFNGNIKNPFTVVLPQPSSFFSKDIFDHYGPLDESLHFSMDMDFWLKLAHNNVNFSVLEEDLTYFRIHENAKSYSGNSPFVDEMIKKYCAMLNTQQYECYSREHVKSILYDYVKFGKFHRSKSLIVRLLYLFRLVKISPKKVFKDLIRLNDTSRDQK